MDLRAGVSRPTCIALFVAGCAALAGAVGYGAHWWWTARHIESTDDAYVAGDIVRISPRVAGYVEEVEVGDNARVRVGDVLVRIDPRDHRARYERAQADVAVAEAAIADIDANRRLQDAIIDRERAGVAAAEAEMARARLDLDRYRTLSDSAYASRQRYEQADADDRRARAQNEQARAALAAALRRVEVLQASRSAAEATLAQAAANRELARVDLEATVLRAPVEGVVGNRVARPGAYVKAGADLMAIVPARGLWIEANFKETQLANIRPGDAATIEIDAAPGVRLTAEVESFAPATGAEFSLLPPENATGNFTKIVQRVPVKIMLLGEDDALGMLRPGLSVVARVDTRRRDEAGPETAGRGVGR